MLTTVNSDGEIVQPVHDNPAPIAPMSHQQIRSQDLSWVTFLFGNSTTGATLAEEAYPIGRSDLLCRLGRPKAYRMLFTCGIGHGLVSSRQ
jgi:hypothetical protein